MRIHIVTNPHHTPSVSLVHGIWQTWYLLFVGQPRVPQIHLLLWCMGIDIGIGTGIGIGKNVLRTRKIMNPVPKSCRSELFDDRAEVMVCAVLDFSLECSGTVYHTVLDSTEIRP